MTGFSFVPLDADLPEFTESPHFFCSVPAVENIMTVIDIRSLAHGIVSCNDECGLNLDDIHIRKEL